MKTYYVICWWDVSPPNTLKKSLTLGTDLMITLERGNITGIGKLENHQNGKI